MTTIHVTAEHIASGTQHSERSCPLALALIDAGYTSVRVGTSMLRATSPDGGVVEAYHPDGDPVRRFILDFDQGRDLVNPCVLDVRMTPIRSWHRIRFIGGTLDYD